MYQSDQKINILIYFNAPLNDIQMFYTKYLTMDKMHTLADAIRKLLYGCAYVGEDNPLAKARGLSSRTETVFLRGRSLNL